MSKPFINKGFKPLSQLSVFLGALGLSMILAGFASYGIAMLAKMPMGDTEAMMQPQFIPALKSMQVVSSFLIFGLPAIVYAFVCYKNGWTVLGLRQPWVVQITLLAIAIMLVAVPVSDALGTINKAIPLPASWKAYFDGKEYLNESQVKMMLDISSVKGLILSLLLIAALPALVEELFFRGALQGMFLRLWGKPWAAIVLTSVIFSAIHFSWYGFIPRAMLGVVLGTVYYITGNLWYCILMHFLYNGAAVVYLYAMHQQGKPLDMGNSTIFPVWAGALAAVVVAILVWWLRQINPPVIPKEVMNRKNYPFLPAEQNP